MQPTPDRRPVHRRARLLSARPSTTTFEVPAVPTLESPKPPQWATMLVPVLSTGSVTFFGIASGQRYLIWTGLIVTLAAIVTPFVTFLSTRRTAGQRNASRHERYSRLLDTTAKAVDRARTEVGLALRATHPTPNDLLHWIDNNRLWERRTDDEDFASVVVGIADVPSGLEVVIGAANALDADLPPELEHRARELAWGAATLTDAPLCVDLRASGVIGLEGPRPYTAALARAMLLEAIVCCGPDELALLVIADDPLHGEWRWATRVPHALRWESGTDGTMTATIATGVTAPAALARAVAPRVRLRDESHASAQAAGLPHLIIVVDDFGRPHSADHQPLLHEAIAGAVELGITVLAITQHGAASPAEASILLEVKHAAAARLQPVRSPLAATPFVPRGADIDTAKWVADRLHGHWPVTDLAFASDSSSDLLLDLIGGREALTGPVHWPGPPSLLTAALGVLSDGERCVLDLKESAAGGSGPHGLLIGATGSGKSELLRTLITSLAITHPPHLLHVAFVDFKGGAAFDELRQLPHCAGLVTNIDDPTLTARMRASLIGELQSRQRLLFDAGPGVQNIRDYWERWYRQPAMPPMPYLLIVIDEFAELTEADPAFLDALISVGRLGRSVGMHLLLSSQRLEGARIHGLDSHLSYRIAMRTFTPEESVTVLGSRVAADLPTVPGHGYLRTGPEVRRFKAAQVFQPHGADARSDLARVIAWTSAVPKSPPLWLAPLPNALHLEYLPLDDERLGAEPDEPQARLPVAVGLLDDPAQREQRPVLVDVTAPGGHLAVTGAPQSGKSSVLAVELLRAARAYPPYLLRFFVLDFGGGALATAARLPNVAAYATPQEPDRVARIMTEVAALLDRRPLEFQRDGDGGMPDRRQRAIDSRSEASQAHTVLMIDNIAVFETRFGDYKDTIARVLNEGSSYGVHLHVTTPRWSALGPKRLDQIATRFELRLLELADSQHSRTAAAAIAQAGAGRALGPDGLYLQFAAPFHETTAGNGPQPLGVAVDRIVAEATELRPGVTAAPLPLLQDLTAQRFHDAEHMSAGDGRVMIGVDEGSFAPVCFTPGRDGNLVYLGDLHSGRTTTLARLVGAATAAGHADTYVVDLRGDLLAAAPRPTGAASNTDELEALARDLEHRLDARRSGRDDADSRPILLVIDDCDLLQVIYTGAGRTNPLAALGPHVLLASRLGLSVVVNHLPLHTMMRDQLTLRVLESGGWRVQFSTAGPRSELPTGYVGRVLPAGVGRLIRPGRSESLMQTLPPRA